jgi:rfaE bifunctional protein nucleotidyltransferase chain/domain
MTADKTMKIRNPADLPGLRAEHADRTIGFCTGCFDILHSGHAIFFEQCREHADILVVGVGSDDTLRSLKGASRPILPEANRLYLIAALADVDYVVLNGELTENNIDFKATLEALRPNVFVVNDDDAEIAAKQALCDAVGTRLQAVPCVVPEYLKPTSTTGIIERVDQALRCPLRLDFAGGWTDIPALMGDDFGYVTSAAIKPHVEYRHGAFNYSGYPRGSGLTTSTAAKMLEMLGSPHYVAANKDLRVIAEDLFQYENKELNWAIGRQDMYALTYGGVRCYECRAGTAVPLPSSVSPATIARLESEIVILHSSQSRNAQCVAEEVHQRHQAPEGRRTLNRMAELGRNFATSLTDDDIEACGEIMHENWELQKILAPASTSDSLDAIYAYAHQLGARGKLCGAGGGGAYAFRAKDVDAFIFDMKKKFPVCFEIDFSFEPRDIKTLNGI